MDDLELAKLAFHKSSIQAYIAARMMLATSHLSPIGLYNAHLACECMLKSLAAQAGQRPKPKHDLTFLFDKLTSLNASPVLREAKLLEIFKWLNPYQELGRYGALARAQFDPDRKDDQNIQAYGVMSYQPGEDIKKIDYAFALLYKLSDIEDDLVKQVARSEPTPYWVYPIPLEELLFFENDYLSHPG